MSRLCIKHRRKAVAQWRICSTGKWEHVCRQCDLELNMLALQWRYPLTWERRFESYKDKLSGGQKHQRQSAHTADPAVSSTKAKAQSRRTYAGTKGLVACAQ